MDVYGNKVPLDAGSGRSRSASLSKSRVNSILQGVAISIGGLALLVVSDLVTGKDGHASNRGLGDALMVVAATIFGICAFLDGYIMNWVDSFLAQPIRQRSSL